MTEDDWKEIQASVTLIKTTSLARINGKFWSVYRVGLIVRIDIKND